MSADHGSLARRTRSEPSSTEIRKLSTLLEISQSLSGTLDLRSALNRVLEVLAKYHGAVQSYVALTKDDLGGLQIEASRELEVGRDVRYRQGEGITGRVAQSGRPVVVPRMSQESSLAHDPAMRQPKPDHELTLIAVPILISRRAAGVMVVVLRFNRERDYERSVKFLGVVASMIAQALKMQRVVELERRRLVDENVSLRQELIERYDFANMIGGSGAMRDVLEKVAQVAPSNTTVLIRGESGTGKELIAQAIHYNSGRKKKAFIKVSCAALPETLIESELFGYERGAFTGADTRRKGRFELADGGTLFLDEIGEVSAATQIKLLRVLQEREFERLGSTETVKVNVRLIAATNRPLEKAIADGTFREDLFYRLNVFTIVVPPIRERKSDIPSLSDHFLLKFARQHGKAIKRISTPAIDMLVAYHWPGNVRELENAIESAVVVCDDGVIHAHHLPPTLQTAEASDTMPHVTLPQALRAYEKDLIQDVLKSTRGNRAKAARLLGITERMMGYKVRKHVIDWRRFRR